MVVKDYESEEFTFLSILLFSENINIDVYDKAFTLTKREMFYDCRAKAIYNVIKETYKDNEELLGQRQYVIKVSSIMEIEHNIEQTFILDVHKYWLPPAVMNKQIKAIQERYFNEEFKLAKTEEDFNLVLKEKDEYTFVDDMEKILQDVDNFQVDYNKRKSSAIFTSYPSLNDVIGSWQGGDMIILAGGTGGGKTCAMLNFVTGIAKQGKKVDIFSLEMPKIQLQQRMICAEASIDASKFRSFSLTSEDKRKYAECARGTFSELNIRIFKKQNVSIEKLRYLVMRSDADIIFIDYLGLINSYSNRGAYERFSEISRNIKLIAMASNKPIVALHQLNRDFQNREDKTPKLSDIRDSGKIEQDADMVIFVHRPGIYEPEKYSKETLQMIIAKNRFGKSNVTLPFVFNGINQRITEPIAV